MKPELDILRIQETELVEGEHPAILEMAAHDGRILITHDHRTMPGHAWDRVAEGKPLSGVFVIKQNMPVAQAIEELLTLAECSSEDEWRDRVIYLPL